MVWKFFIIGSTLLNWKKMVISIGIMKALKTISRMRIMMTITMRIDRDEENWNQTEGLLGKEIEVLEKNKKSKKKKAFGG